LKTGFWSKAKWSASPTDSLSQKVLAMRTKRE
jgi:hypothetical protein